MIVLGAGGLAKDLLNIIPEHENLYFYDDVNCHNENKFLGKYPIIKTEKDFANEVANGNDDFVLGAGNPLLRSSLTDKFESLGGKIKSLISKDSFIGNNFTEIDKGVCILSFAQISNCVKLGKGCLIYNFVLVSHDVIVGEFCEISPGAKLLGGAYIGKMTSIGSNAVIFPNIKIGERCKVGAGAVVTKDIPDGSTAVGVPARIL